MFVYHDGAATVIMAIADRGNIGSGVDLAAGVSNRNATLTQ